MQSPVYRCFGHRHTDVIPHRYNDVRSIVIPTWICRYTDAYDHRYNDVKVHRNNDAIYHRYNNDYLSLYRRPYNFPIGIYIPTAHYRHTDKPCTSIYRCQWAAVYRRMDIRYTDDLASVYRSYKHRYNDDVVHRYTGVECIGIPTPNYRHTDEPCTSVYRCQWAAVYRRMCFRYTDDFTWVYRCHDRRYKDD
jgi:hypothetical protein